MARKDPFQTLRIRKVILDLLRPLLEGENKDQFRPLSLNAYCEKILWDYAQGQFIRREGVRRVKVVEAVERGEAQEEAEKAGHRRHRSK